MSVKNESIENYLLINDLNYINKLSLIKKEVKFEDLTENEIIKGIIRILTIEDIKEK